MMMATKEQIEQLAEAMWQLLDDMGRSTNAPCRAAHAAARIAYEPFRDHEDHPDWMPLDEAKQILKDCGG